MQGDTLSKLRRGSGLCGQSVQNMPPPNMSLLFPGLVSRPALACAPLSTKAPENQQRQDQVLKRGPSSPSGKEPMAPSHARRRRTSPFLRAEDTGSYLHKATGSSPLRPSFPGQLPTTSLPRPEGPAPPPCSAPDGDPPPSDRPSGHSGPGAPMYSPMRLKEIRKPLLLPRCAVCRRRSRRCPGCSCRRKSCSSLYRSRSEQKRKTETGVKVLKEGFAEPTTEAGA